MIAMGWGMGIAGGRWCIKKHACSMFYHLSSEVEKCCRVVQPGGHHGINTSGSSMNNCTQCEFGKGSWLRSPGGRCSINTDAFPINKYPYCEAKEDCRMRSPGERHGTETRALRMFIFNP
jgi:hypothetical protein